MFFTVYTRALPVLFSRILQFEFLHKRLNPCTSITKAAVQIRNNNKQRMKFKLAITVPVIRITEQYSNVPFHSYVHKDNIQSFKKKSPGTVLCNIQYEHYNI
jgi:hypothetical protein